MKKIALAMMLLAGVALSAPSVHAQVSDSENFVVSATIPLASAINIVAVEVDGQTGQFGNTVTALNFDPMVLDTGLGVFFPDHFFAIDIGTSGGAGTPSVTVTYTEGSNPNSPGNGLGWKSTLTFVQVTGLEPNQVETPLAAHGPKKLMKDLSGETVSSAEIAGGFLRMYAGIFTGDPNATIPEPANGEVFSLGDNAGSYSGTLTISATVV
ncbi:MAG: hypothetical protein KC684_04660 [Candidatus Omnitrophica bacterium]|nr:hypothetical protein [Candidatus Omnitrophota bacterium]MCA9405804.1 hypothetical protein [Candidatus Omnitrophota bacterium]